GEIEGLRPRKDEDRNDDGGEDPAPFYRVPVRRGPLDDDGAGNADGNEEEGDAEIDVVAAEPVALFGAIEPEAAARTVGCFAKPADQDGTAATRNAAEEERAAENAQRMHGHRSRALRRMNATAAGSCRERGRESRLAARRGSDGPRR